MKTITGGNMDTMELEGRIEEMRKEVEFHYHQAAVSTRLVDRRGSLLHEQVARAVEDQIEELIRRGSHR